MLQSEPPDPPLTGDTMKKNEQQQKLNELTEGLERLTQRVALLMRRLHELEDENAELLRLHKAVAELQATMKEEGHWFVNDLNVEVKY